MAKRFDELIEYLLIEIAVAGPAGISVSQLTDFLKWFYGTIASAEQYQDPTTTTLAPASPTQTIDVAFIDRVWEWLRKHPEVSIGKHGKFNNTALQYFQSPDDIDELLNYGSPTPRIYVSETLTYRAICGHHPDPARLSASEYALLAEIAVTRIDGILQCALDRGIGQGKGSLPKRIDALQEKGYIVKQPVSVDGHPTNRLLLRRYAPNSQASRSTVISATSNNDKQLVRHVIQRLSDRLCEGTFVELDQLLSILDDKNDAGQKILSKIIRNLEKIGCLKRVRMTVGPAAHSGDLKSYVQQIKAPTEADLLRFEKAAVSLDRPISEWVEEENAKRSPRDSQNEPEPSETSQSVIQWNPDRCFINQLRQVLSQKGSDGLTDTFAPTPVSSQLFSRIAQPTSTRSPPGPLNNPVRSLEASLINADPIWDSLKLLHGGPLVQPEDLANQTSLKTAKPLSSRDVPGARSDQAHLPSLGTLVQAVKATDMLPVDGEPQIVIDDEGIEVVKRFDKEQQVAEVEEVEMRYITPSRQIKARRKFRHGNEYKRPQGRPRKFVRGTERFWQYQFWQAKLAANGEGNAPPTRDGVMNDRAGLEVFENRPDGLDETILGAKAAGLPLPAAPDDVSEDWVRQTQAVLQRSDDGIYITPIGMYLGRVSYRSQLLIVRSSRLNSVDWFDRTMIPEFRFITSSIAHSFQVRRYYPQMAKAPLQSRRPNQKIKILDQAKDMLEKIRKPTSGSAPQLGVFSEPLNFTGKSGLSALQRDLPPLPTQDVSYYQQYMDTTDSESDIHLVRLQAKLKKDRRPQTRTLSNDYLLDTALNKPQLNASPNVSSSANTRDMSESFTQQDGNPQSASLLMRSRTGEVDRRLQTVLIVPTATRELTSGPSNLLPELEEPGEVSRGEATSVGTSPRVRHPETLSNTHIAVANNQAADHPPDMTEVEASALNPGRSPNLPPTIDLQVAFNEEKGRRKSLPVSPEAFSGRILSNSLAPPVDSRVHMELSPNIDGTQDFDAPRVEPQIDEERRSLVDKNTPDSSRTRKRSPSPIGSEVFEPLGSVKRRKRVSEGTGGCCQRIILELVTLADGVAPNDRTTIQRCMRGRWQAAGGKGVPLITPIKAAINSLVDSEQLKEHFFTFRGKGGVVIKRSILHLPSIDATGDQINQVKSDIIDADATEYMPPQWVAEVSSPVKAMGTGRRTTLNKDRHSLQLSPTPDESPPHDAEYRPDTGEPVALTPTNARPKRTPKSKRSRDESIASLEDVTASPASATSAATAFLTLKLRSASPGFSPSPPLIGFLTLKVSGLSNLPQVQAFNARLEEPSWKAALAAKAPNLAAERSLPIATPSSAPASERKARPKRQRRKPVRNDDNARNIVWAPSEQFIPESLGHLLGLEDDKSHASENAVEDDPTPILLRKIETIAAWEERDATPIQSADARWTYINLSSSGNLLKSLPVQTWYLVNWDDDFQELQDESVEFPSYPPFVAAQRSDRSRQRQAATREISILQDSVVTPASERRVTREATGAVKKRRWTSLDIDNEDFTLPKRARKADVSVRDQPFQILDDSDDLDEEFTTLAKSRPKKTVVKSQPSRGRRFLVGESLQFAIAVVCVRTLTGGIEKVVDWATLLKALPDVTEQWAKGRWKSITQSYSFEVGRLNDSFQDLYLDAFEKGEAPLVDFDNLENTDWRELITWATSRLNPAKLYKGKDSIAGSRAQLLQKHEILVEKARGQEEIFGYNPHMTYLVREETYSSILSGTRLSPTPHQACALEGNQRELELQDASFAAARSSVLALIQTPDTSFDSQNGDQKLVSLGKTEAERQAATKKVVNTLQRDKFLIQRPSDRIKHEGVRQWKLSRAFDDSLGSQRLVQHAMLKTAAAFKMTTLDKAFSRGENMTIAKDAMIDDGVMVAILNLLSQERIQIRHGSDVPNSRYGVDWEKVGYQTKLIDKSKVAFSTVLQPTNAYVVGDPVAKVRNTVVPRGSVGQGQIQIPMWIDINNSLLIERWEMVLAAVLGLISVRPGCSGSDVAQMMNWTLTPWEGDLVLHWGEKCGFVQQTPSGWGWETKEWWWMAVGNDVMWS